MANGNTPTADTSDLGIGIAPEAATEDQFIGANADNGGSTEARRSAPEVVRQEAGKLTEQAGDKLRAFADDGKERATGALDDFARMIDEAAVTIDEKVGSQFGGYARQASSAVSNLAGSLRDKDVDDLVDDARDLVRRSPAIAIGAAAAVGFVLSRVLRSSVDANRGGSDFDADRRA